MERRVLLVWVVPWERWAVIFHYRDKPAGIGIYRSNDAMMSFSFSSYGTESNYMGSKINSDKTRASFDNAGFVLSSKIGNCHSLGVSEFRF